MKAVVAVVLVAAFTIYVSGQQQQDEGPRSFSSVMELKQKFWKKCNEWIKKTINGNDNGPKAIKASDPCFQQQPQMSGSMFKLPDNCNKTEPPKDIQVEGESYDESCTEIKFKTKDGIMVLKKIIFFKPKKNGSSSSNNQSSSSTMQSSQSSQETVAPRFSP